MKLRSVDKRSARVTKRWRGFETLEPRQLLTAVPMITEFMAVNDGVLLDQDGAKSDWIEISNTGDTPADLTGWFLTDSASNLQKWAFPAMTLAPGAFEIVFASSKDRAVAGSELHTNFALSSGGEFLALVHGTSIESSYAPQFPPQRTNISFGIRSDAGGFHPGDLRFFSPSTPGAVNGDGYLGVTDAPQFSVPHGFYTSPQNLALSTTPPGAEIRYTLDGTAPTATSTLYAAPLPVSHITLLRAATFKTGFLPSTAETQTYLFKNDVLTQTRPTSGGYPTDWGTAPPFPIFGLPAYLTPADYDVDPEVVNNPAYTADFLAGLTSIPSVSVVMNADDLFGSAGIYSHPWERGDAWERATSVELINPDGTPGFQINASAEILGNASRQPLLSPKHSLQINFNSNYGPSELDYPLFGTGPGKVDTFNSFVLRANLSDAWTSPQGSVAVLGFAGTQGRPRAQYARDNFARETQLAMGELAPMSNYVHLFINGLYWGLYDLIERRDDDFVASHLGGAKTDYDVLQDDVFGDSGLVVQGDTVAWDAMFALANAGLANSAQYQQIQQYLDIDKFIDYMNLHLYVGSQDWPNNNWTAYRPREVGGKFQFLTWDAEYTLQDPTINRTGVSNAASPGQLFAALRNNAEFRLKFADRANHWLFNGGLLTAGPAAARYTALVNQINTAIVGESARWGDYRRDVNPIVDPPYELSTRNNQWTTEQTRLLTTYFPARTGNVINQYIAAGLYPSLTAATYNKQGGQVTSGFQLTMSAPAGTIFYTLDGSDPRLEGGAISPTAVTYTTVPVTLAHNTHVNARVKNGSVWSAMNAADFTVEPPTVRITELMYNPTASPPGGAFDKEEFEYVEIYNFGAAPVDMTGMKLQDGISYTFGSVSLGAGQYLVVYVNQAAFTSRYGAGVNAVGPYTGKLSNGGEAITFVDAGGAPIQDTFAYVDSWYPTTDGGGYSLIIRDPVGPLANWGLQSGWRASSELLGSPGVADPLIAGRRVFYNNSSFDGQDPAAGNADDAAVAGDKTALRPGGTSTFANITSYDKGLNGIMIDVATTPVGLTAADFEFRIGDDNSPDLWPAAPVLPNVSVRTGKGAGGTNRVALIWPDGAITNTFLQVVVKANSHTGLLAADVFYFGNLVGDAGWGNDSEVAFTDATDIIATRSHAATAVAVTNAFDYNRDGNVDQLDQTVARTHAGELLMISLVAQGLTAEATAAVAFSLTASASPTTTAPPPARWDDLVSLEPPSDSSPQQNAPAAVDAAFAATDAVELGDTAEDDMEEWSGVGVGG